jgi:hypothetical protein
MDLKARFAPPTCSASGRSNAPQAIQQECSSRRVPLDKSQRDRTYLWRTWPPRYLTGEVHLLLQ